MAQRRRGTRTAQERAELGAMISKGRADARAVDWMEKNRPMDEEPARCRGEARELLGIKNVSKP